MRYSREKLQRARERLGYSIEMVGEKAGTSKNSVLRAEHEGEIRPLTARKIAEALGVEVADLVEEMEATPKAQSRTSPEAHEEDASEEARLSFLEAWRESILAVVNKLGKEFETVREGGDREDLLTLYSLVALSRIGAEASLDAEEVMQEREGDSDEEHRARDRAWRALLRFDDLAEDVEEVIAEDPEEMPAPVVRIADHRRRQAG